LVGPACYASAGDAQEMHLPDDPAEARGGIPTAVRKSFLILEALARAPRPLPSQHLAQELGLTRSTLSRLALSLAQLGYVERSSPGGGWQLGPAALRLGLAQLAKVDIRGVAAPLMRALSEEVDLPVDLAMPVGDDMLHYELAQKAGQLVVATEMGARLPILSTALGHAALFAMDRRNQAETLRRLRLGAGSDWPVQEKALATSFRQLERDGFCIVSGMLRADVAAVGAPFVDPRSRTVFSFSCSAVGFQIETGRFQQEIGPKLLRMVRQVGAAMGGVLHG
jgi:DNA-binding IclR family transcriptional regulator